MAQRGSREMMRELNVSLLIELVRSAGSISRAELARQSQLSAPTVGTIVEQLVERGILVEVALAPSNGGRPAVLLSIDSTAGYVVGIKLRGDGLTTVVCDLETQVVASREVAVSLIGDPEVAMNAIVEEVRQVLREARITRSKVLGVGIGLSGVIDTTSGVCVSSHLLQWHNVELESKLRRLLRLPVWIDNDVNTLAVAEKWSGDAKGAKHFVTLSIGRGIGLGIVIDRSLYRGAFGSSGEFGHIIIEQGGPLCECGRSGCLEALVGEDSMRRQVADHLGRKITREELIYLVKAGDPIVCEVAASAGRKLGLSVANVLTILNPELLIICGEGTELGPTFLDPIVRAVREETFAELGLKIDIRIQSWGDEAWAVGAATLVLRESFSHPGSDTRSLAIWHRVGN
jgi:predicted NBD/HSP70 family sugar kinase